MVDVPLTQFPPGQSPAIAAAVAGLLCAVLGAVQIVDGFVTTMADEPTVVAQLVAATGVLHTASAVDLEQARWRAAAKVVASA